MHAINITSIAMYKVKLIKDDIIGSLDCVSQGYNYHTICCLV